MESDTRPLFSIKSGSGGESYGFSSFAVRLAEHFQIRKKEELNMRIYEYKTVLAREADGTVSITGHRMICSVCES